MKKINLDDVFDVNKLVSELIATLDGGGVIAMPLDAGYGVLVAERCVDAVEKVRGILQSNGSESYLVGNISAVKSFFNVGEVVDELVESFLPGVLLVESEGAGLHEGSFVKVKYPEHSFLNFLCEQFDGSLLVFEANLAGKPPVYDLDQLTKQPEVFGLLDLCLDAGTLDLVTLPTIVKVDDNQLEVLREGKLVPKLVVQFSIKETT